MADPEGAGAKEHVFAAPPGGTLTVEVFANDTCSGARWPPSPSPLTTPPPATNPPLVAACTTLQVAVILDESGSIASAGATQQVRNATNALAQGLVDTGASMAVFKFSHERQLEHDPPYQTVTAGFISGQLATYLAAYNPNGFTNWDDGLEQMRLRDGRRPAGPRHLPHRRQPEPLRVGRIGRSRRASTRRWCRRSPRLIRSRASARTCSSSASAPASPTR